MTLSLACVASSSPSAFIWIAVTQERVYEYVKMKQKEQEVRKGEKGRKKIEKLVSVEKGEERGKDGNKGGRNVSANLLTP